MKLLTLSLLLVVSGSMCLFSAGCGKIRDERDQARADAAAAQTRCMELELRLAGVKEELTAAQTQLAAAQAASQTEIGALKKNIESLTIERDDANKSAEQSATNLLSMLVNMQQQENEYSAQIVSLNKKIEELTRKIVIPK